MTQKTAPLTDEQYEALEEDISQASSELQEIEDDFFGLKDALEHLNEAYELVYEIMDAGSASELLDQVRERVDIAAEDLDGKRQTLNGYLDELIEQRNAADAAEAAEVAASEMA